MITIKDTYTIPDVIKDRMELAGMTQAKLAEHIDCTPTQLSLFLKGEASLNRMSLEKCFKTLGINLDATSKRIELAKEVAKALSAYTLEDVAQMSRAEMIRKSGAKQIEALPDLSKEQFELMISSGLADHEATYPYFKAMVLHLMQTGERLTPKSVEASFNVLAKSLISLPFIPLLGVGTIIGAAVGALAMNKKNHFAHAVNNVWAPLLTLAVNLFENELKKK